MSKLLERIAEINRECFTKDDPYSSVDYLKRLVKEGCKIITVKEEGDIVGYIIYQELRTHIESLRRGFTKSHRGKGKGKRLSKRLTRIADSCGKDVYTYISKSNLPSLNSNLRVGYTVDAINEDWVYVRYKAKKRVPKDPQNP